MRRCKYVKIRDGYQDIRQVNGMRLLEIVNGEKNYRKMTAEEAAEFMRHHDVIPEPEPTPEERLAIMEDAFAELCEVIFNG